MPGTVYIVGAGASYEDTKKAALPLPLATQFFAPSYLKKHWHPLSMGGEFDASALAFVLKQYFAFIPPDKTASVLSGVNIEEVYSFLDRYRSFYSTVGQRAQLLERARSELMEYVVNVIRYGAFHAEKFPFYDKLVGKMKEGDSILSFNWDVCLDRALEKRALGRKLLRRFQEILVPQRNPGLRADSTKAHSRYHQGVFLKLHGGVNLTICSNESCANPLLWDPDEEIPEWWGCDICGAATRVFIVPPHVHKTYGYHRLLSLQARIAAQKIELAERIVVIGYSFPLFDFEARTMMRSARLEDKEAIEYSEMWLRNVTVVNPSVTETAYVNIVRDLLGIDCPTAHGHKVDFLTYSSADEYFRKR